MGQVTSEATDTFMETSSLTGDMRTQEPGTVDLGSVESWQEAYPGLLSELRHPAVLSR